MTRPVVGGRRRVDRVLEPTFVAGLESLSMPELRERRREAEQEDADLSYLRRLLHGRIDILAAELARRAAGAEAPSVLDSLAEVLADPERSVHGSGKHLRVEPTRVDEHRRVVERAVADVETSDVSARSDAQIESDLARLAEHEAEVSEVRREVQHVADLLSAEIGRRYREGLASVDALLTPDSAE